MCSSPMKHSTSPIAVGLIVTWLLSGSSTFPSPQVGERKLRERDALATKAEELADAGKYPEALKAAERALAITQDVLGSKQAERIIYLSRVAELRKLTGDFEGAVADRKELLALE